MLLSQMFIYVTFCYAYQFRYQISAWFFKISIFNSQNGQEGGTASLCQILSKSLQPWPRYRDLFRYFEMASWRLQPSWIFKIGNFQRSERSRGSNCLTMPNFVEIAPNAAEIWRFCDFSRWRTPPCWIFKISNF